MSNYAKIVDYAAKDLLLHLDPAKAIKGTEVGAEFDAIAAMSVTKAELAGSASQAFSASSLTSAGKVSGATATGVGVSSAIVGVASSSGYGVYGASDSGMGVSGYSSSSVGIYGTSVSNVGVYGASSSWYGVIAQSDPTSPAKSAFRIVPQDAEPTGANAVGDIYVTTAGVLKICTVAGTPGTWSQYAELAGSASQAFAALSLTSAGKVSGATATGTTTNAAVVGVASTSGNGGYFLSSSGSAIICGSTSGNGIYGVSADSYGGSFDSTNNHGVHGTSTYSYGVYGYGGASVGVYGGSNSGYGVVAESDITSPVKAAFRIVPQDTQPSGANSVGDIYVTTAGVLKICTVAGTPGTWVSVGAQT